MPYTYVNNNVGLQVDHQFSDVDVLDPRKLQGFDVLERHLIDDRGHADKLLLRKCTGEGFTLNGITIIFSRLEEEALRNEQLELLSDTPVLVR